MWSRIWLEDLDYGSGSAGLVLSRQAALQLVQGMELAAREAARRQVAPSSASPQPGGDSLASFPQFPATGSSILDSSSGGAGGLLGSGAELAHVLESCHLASVAAWTDQALSRCAWAARVQLVHAPGFNHGGPPRPLDRHGNVWLPPLAEALTFHAQLTPVEQSRMSAYVNRRWGFDDGSARSPLLSSQVQQSGLGVR